MTETPSHPLENELRVHVENNFDNTVGRLAEFVRIPSVSWPAFDRAHVAKSAEHVKELFESTGLFDEIDIHQYPISDDEMGQPGIIAHRAPKPGMPTVLLYAHHDVQPQGDAKNWETDPFEPVIKGERMYGRGASDDKAGVMLHLSSLEAVRDVLGEDFGVGISLFIEGEEENGSGSFTKFLDNHRKELDANYIVVADSDNPSPETPGLTVALRGNVTMNVTIRSLRYASHSGMYGGAAPDAMLTAIRLLDTLWNEDGSVAVEGFGTHEAEVPEATEQQYVDEAGVVGGQLLGSGPVLSRLWYKPAITVTGIDAPDVANASNTLIPEVRVRISARIAPGTDATAQAEALMNHLRSNVPFGAEVEFDSVDSGRPFLVDINGDGAQRMQDAMATGWGQAPELAGIGGSIPFIPDLVDRFPNAQVLVTGVEDPETRAHSPNESQHLGALRKAIVAEALFIAGLAQQ